jgi:[NiFe] hydrogenase assembly chaperone, HybE family
MTALAYQGFGNAREIGPATRLECKICWTVYDPAEGDPAWQVPPGTPFDRLPPHWSCPTCSATREQFMVIDDGVAGSDHGDAETPLPDPSARLNAAFRGAAQRMQGLGLVNPALEVEAVDISPWQDQWLGVMVTPWFMNLVLLPRIRSRWQSLPVGGKRKLLFPAGVYEFIGATDAVVGEHQTCSLFSPMHEFESHAAARLVAQLARAALFDPANAEVPERVGAAPSSSTGAAPRAHGEQATVSRRDLLRGRLIGGGDAD